ncbi:hypothetical protein [Variovorax sp. YR216]|uniref:hypothetical protein n=1 Tax=Variovorax sp. YR216 TaxID=1882828 RepID=UPI00115FFBD3|nr:hypothetical protein [Variovorax sp. YR216]
MDKTFSSARIEQLRRDAQKLKKQRSLSMHEALDAVAQRVGYPGWSRLVAAGSTRSEEAFTARIGTCFSSSPRPLTPTAGLLYCSQCKMFEPEGHFLENIFHMPMDEPLLLAFVEHLRLLSAEPRDVHTREQAMAALARLHAALETLGASEEQK